MRDSIREIINYYGNARKRALRRQSPWNLILIPLGLAFWLGIWYALFRLVWAFHIALYPLHKLQEFWQSGISFPSFVFSFFMVFALMPGSICLGFALTNCSAWLIKPARDVFNIESIGYPGTSFREATFTLFVLSAWSVPIGLIISLGSAWALTSLK
jgi:hypothetical protein